MTGGKAFFIYGAESTCTRLMRRIFIAAGCQGDGGLEQQFDYGGLPSAEEVLLIAWGRSVPGSTPRSYPAFAREWQMVMKRGYKPHVIVMVRDWFCMLESQVNTSFKGATNLEQAQRWAEKAYVKLFSALDGAEVPYLIVTFEALQQRPKQFIRRLMASCDLPMPESLEEIYDANEPYYASLLLGEEQGTNSWSCRGDGDRS